MEKLLLPGILLLSFLYIFYQRWVYRDKDDKGPELTGPATVKARRVDQGSYQGKAPTGYQGNTRGNRNYLITFTLSDGEELELYVGESEYRALKEGLSGTLTWQGQKFRSFDYDD